MKLYEIAEGEPIQVFAKIEQASAEYETTVAFCREGILLAEPIRYDGKIINFSGENVHIGVVYVADGEKPLIWEGCGVQNIQLKNEKYLALVSKKEGVKWNRRQAYRQYLGIRGMLSIDATRAQKEVMVKDISSSGVSFIVPVEMTCASVGAFHLMFEDRENRLKIQLAGTAVREEQVDETRKIIGCSVQKANVDLGSYVASKQKQEIAKRHGK